VTLPGPEQPGSPASAAGEDAPLDFRVLSGNPTAAELAAITAVLSAMVEEAESSQRLAGSRGESAWQKSQRAIRTQLTPGYGAWRSFSA
jgi:hypothetical protein